jgi:hypothetical protein
MIYLVVGIDHTTRTPWHKSIAADDVRNAPRIAIARADALGIDLIIAAVVGPNPSVLSHHPARWLSLRASEVVP